MIFGLVLNSLSAGRSDMALPSSANLPRARRFLLIVDLPLLPAKESHS
jgi:hypothetical protein